MSTVKITDLPVISHLNADTANTIFVGVDLPTDVTGRISASVLADGLYENTALKVGLPDIMFPNVIAQFAGSGDPYLQVNAQNTDANNSIDYVATADIGTTANNFIDMGINNSLYDDPDFSAQKALDGYLYVHGSVDSSSDGNLIIGTVSSGANVVFAVGGQKSANVVATISRYGLSMNGASYIKFADGSIQSVAAAPSNYAQSAFDKANTASANTIITQGVDATQNTNITAVNNYAASGYAKANTAVQNTAVIQLQALTLTGNLIANSVGQGIFVDTFTSNSATFSRNVTILGNLTSNTLAGNVFFSNVTVGSSQANSIQWFAQTESPTQTSGQVWYSANTISLVQDTDIAGDRPAISKVLFERVYNNTGSAIPNSSWVRLAGGVTSNSVPFIQLADATSAANSQVEGFVKVGIAAGSYGFVYTRGIVDGMDASSFGNNGQLIFLSTTPGQASNIAPTGANSVVALAKILSNGSANGKLQVVISSQQAYGKPNGAILFANNNLIQASNTLFINETLGQLNVSSTMYAANGIINRSNTYTGTQTAITVNMTTETWVRATVGASLTITPTGFGPGYETEVVITNPNTGGGAARTITHGCSATNSSVGATTFTLGGTTTAFVKYYSFDSDLANTYAKISFS
jgi:hypothetical protein